jgi:dimethylargininase
LPEPATLEGGDVMRIGRDIFVGLSSRTNEAGVSCLADELRPFGYRVRAIEVHGCLHLKSACCPIGDGAILANRAWFDERPLRDYPIVDVADEEPGAANILNVGGALLMPSGYPKTEQLLRNRNLTVRTIDISELMKAEAAMTCSSVIFETWP